LRFFGKTTPYGKIYFENSVPKVYMRHRLTLLCSNVVKVARREIVEIVRYIHVIYPHKNRLPLKLSLLCGSRPKSTRASPQHLAHTNRFTFGGVVAERVNTVFSP